MSSPGVTSGVDPNSTAGIVASLVPLVQAGLQAWDQQSLLQFNQQLIAQGKSPLSPDQISQLMTGVQPTVNLGISTQAQQILWYALIGAGALALLYIFMRSTR